MYSTNPTRRANINTRIPTRRKAIFELDTTYSSQDLSLFTHPFNARSPFDTDENDDYSPQTHLRPRHQHTPLRDSSMLPSCVSALLRRCAALNSALSHFTAVVEPLKIMKTENVSERHVVDVRFEAERVKKAFGELEIQLEEVRGILDDLRERKGMLY